MYPQKSADIFKIYINKHLPKNHRLHKIFSRNSVKVIYSCTKSMKTTINHNKNILGTKPAISTTNFINCRNKKACPLNRQHQIGEVVYEGTLSSNQNIKKKKWNCRIIFQTAPLHPQLIFQKRIFQKRHGTFYGNQDEELHPANNLENYQESAYHIIITQENVIYV